MPWRLRSCAEWSRGQGLLPWRAVRWRLLLLLERRCHQRLSQRRGRHRRGGGRGTGATGGGWQSWHWHCCRPQVGHCPHVCCSSLYILSVFLVCCLSRVLFVLLSSSVFTLVYLHIYLSGNFLFIFLRLPCLWTSRSHLFCASRTARCVFVSICRLYILRIVFFCIYTRVYMFTCTCIMPIFICTHKHINMSLSDSVYTCLYQHNMPYLCVYLFTYTCVTCSHLFISACRGQQMITDIARHHRPG